MISEFSILLQSPIEKLEQEKYEIIVVNDGSTDETLIRDKEAGATVISHPANSGYGKSVKDGIVVAKYDTIVICEFRVACVFTRDSDNLF